MTGLELLAGYATGYLVRKARRVTGRADAELDQALDVGMDRLHDVVSGVLGADPALAKLEQEAGAESERTLQRVRLAIEDAAEADSDFAEKLEQLIVSLRAADSGTATQVGDQSLAVGRDAHFEATHGGVAGGVFNAPVSTGNPPQPGSVSD